MIKDGSKVKFHYILTVEEEKVESSHGKDPLSYTHGEGEIIPGLESELSGLAEGETKSVEIAPAEGYGERNEQAVQEVPREAFKDTDDLNQGDMVSGEIAGQPFRAMVTEIGDENVVLDLNHPLAGKTLNFEVEVVAVE